MSFFQENDAFFSAFLCGKKRGRKMKTPGLLPETGRSNPFLRTKCAKVGTVSVRLWSECGADWPKRESTSSCSRDGMRARRRDGNPNSGGTRARRRDGNPNPDEPRARRTDGSPNSDGQPGRTAGDPDEPSPRAAEAEHAGVSISAGPEDAGRSRPRSSRDRSNTSLRSTAHIRRKRSCNRNPGSRWLSRQSFPGSS